MKFDVYEKGIIRRIFGLLLFLGFPLFVIMDIFAPFIEGVINCVTHIFGGIINYRTSLESFKDTCKNSWGGLIVFIGKKD